jgi:hypothetical protein
MTKTPEQQKSRMPETHEGAPITSIYKYPVVIEGGLTDEQLEERLSSFPDVIYCLDTEKEKVATMNDRLDIELGRSLGRGDFGTGHHPRIIEVPASDMEALKLTNRSGCGTLYARSKF